MPEPTAESIVRNLMQQLFLILAAEADADPLPVPRAWIAEWLLSLSRVLNLLPGRPA